MSEQLPSPRVQAKAKRPPWKNPEEGKPCAFCGQPFLDDANVVAHRQTLFVGADDVGDWTVTHGDKVIYTHNVCELPPGLDKTRPGPGFRIPTCGV